MDTNNKKKYKELLEKWKNFSKIYYAIFDAYQLGYDKGIEAESNCTKDIAESEKLKELLENWQKFSKVQNDISEAFQLGYNEGIEIEKYCKEMRKAELINSNYMPTAI